MESDGTSFDHVSEPSLCANGCGFFGAAATMNFCSRCFRDLQIKENQTPSARVVMDKILLPKTQETVGVTSVEASSSTPPHGEIPKDKALPNRCHSCRKRVGMLGFSCKCGSTFCGTHRFPEQHNCEFDFKSIGREHIAKANVVVKADKIQHRI